MSDMIDDLRNRTKRAEDAGSAVQRTIDNTARGVGDVADGAVDAAKRTGDLVGKADDFILGLGQKTFGAGEKILGVFGANTQPFGGSDLASTDPTQLPGTASSGGGADTRIPALSIDTKEALPSVDPLKREVSAPFEAVNKKMDDVKGYVFGEKGLLDNLRDGFFNLRDGAFNAVGLDYQDVKARVEMAMDAAKSIAALPGEIQREFYDLVREAEAIRQEVEGKVSIFIDGVQRDFDSVKDYADFLKLDSSLKRWEDSPWDWGDYNTGAALINSVADALANYGMPERVDPIIEKQSPEIQALLWEELVLRSAAGGNLYATEHYATKLKKERKAFVAKPVSVNLLRNLHYDETSNYGDMGKRLLALFESLDKNWDMSVLQTGRVELLFYTIMNSVSINSMITTKKRPYVCAFGCVYYDTSEAIIDRYFPV